MTIRATIIGSDSISDEGWVEVDPFDYEYSGPDPDGEIENYLSSIADGSHTFYWGQEDSRVDDPYPPDLKLIEIDQNLAHFDPIWFLEFPDSFEVTTITYG